MRQYRDLSGEETSLFWPHGSCFKRGAELATAGEEALGWKFKDDAAARLMDRLGSDQIVQSEDY